MVDAIVLLKRERQIGAVRRMRSLIGSEFVLGGEGTACGEVFETGNAVIDAGCSQFTFVKRVGWAHNADEIAQEGAETGVGAAVALLRRYASAFPRAAEFWLRESKFVLGPEAEVAAAVEMEMEMEMEQGSRTAGGRRGKRVAKGRGGSTGRGKGKGTGRRRQRRTAPQNAADKLEAQRELRAKAKASESSTPK